MKKISDNYPKYILTLDDDLDADFDGIKKINVLDWLLEKKSKVLNIPIFMIEYKDKILEIIKE